MFNLFPRKKSVDETLKDAELPIKNWEWTSTQTPSILQAQNELIEKFLKENHDLKLEIQELKNDVHQPELCDEKIAELIKEVNSLRHLKQENADLMEMLAKYRDGYQGSCYACEPVGELNQKLELQIKAYQKMVEGAYETIEKLKNKTNQYPVHWGGYTDETSWEAASADLALRVVKLERIVEKLKLINSKNNLNKNHD